MHGVLCLPLLDNWFWDVYLGSGSPDRLFTHAFGQDLHAVVSHDNIMVLLLDQSVLVIRNDLSLDWHINVSCSHSHRLVVDMSLSVGHWLIINKGLRVFDWLIDGLLSVIFVLWLWFVLFWHLISVLFDDLMTWRVSVDVLSIVTLIDESWAVREVMIRMSENWSDLATKMVIIFPLSLLFLSEALLILLKLLGTWNLRVKRLLGLVRWLLNSSIRLHDMQMMEV